MDLQLIQKLREEVREWVKVNGPSGIMGPIPNRSCWNCNPGHEHLKKVEYPIQCFDCGHTFFKGIDLTEQ